MKKHEGEKKEEKRTATDKVLHVIFNNIFFTIWYPILEDYI